MIRSGSNAILGGSVELPSVGSPLLLHDPRTVGPWAVHSRLGAGGMGVVYYATLGERAAAIKVIRPGLLDAPATRDRFRREVAILRRVRDVHISQFIAAEIDTEPAWLAIEHLRGPLLRDLVTEHGPLPEDQWWTVAEGLSQALAVLEMHRVTHRDIKPGNVILSERGAVLIDFGIAHPEDATALTATGLVTGSPAWLSPEQASLHPVGPASDVFTLGSVLAYAASARPPFGEGAAIAVLTAITQRDPDLAGIDAVRTALLAPMLAKDPSARPSAREVLDLIRDRGRGIPAGPPPGSPRDTTATGPLPAPVAPTTPPDGPAPVPTPGAATPGPPAAGRGRPPTADTTAEQPIEPPAARPSRRRRLVVVALLVAGALAALLWAALGGAGSLLDGLGGSSSWSAAPPAPAANQLRDGPWLLESYRFVNEGTQLDLTGTVRNTGTEPASAQLTVWVYEGGQSLGSVSTEVKDVPPGSAVPVVMTGDAEWRAGSKVVLLDAQ